MFGDSNGQIKLHAKQKIQVSFCYTYMIIIQEVFIRIHKNFPTDKMCTYCSMNKHYLKRDTKTVKVFLKCIDLAMSALCFNNKERQNSSPWLETKSLYCSANRDKKASLNHSKNANKKRFWDFSYDHETCKRHTLKSKEDNYIPPKM